MKKKCFLPIIVMAIIWLMPLYPGAKTCADGEHVWSNWCNVYPATYSEEGLEFRYCTVCYKDQEKAIPVKATTSKQKKVKKVVDIFFAASQSYNTSKMKSCFVSSAKPQLFIQKKYMAKFMKRMNKKLNYDITKIKISGKKAVVTVDCKYRTAIDAYKKAFDDVVLYLVKYPNASDSSIDKYQYQRTLKYYQASEKKYSGKTIKISLKKNNSKWRISKWTDDLDNVVHANYRKAYKNYFKS